MLEIGQTHPGSYLGLRRLERADLVGQVCGSSPHEPTISFQWDSFTSYKAPFQASSTLGLPMTWSVALTSMRVERILPHGDAAHGNWCTARDSVLCKKHGAVSGKSNVGNRPNSSGLLSRAPSLRAGRPGRPGLRFESARAYHFLPMGFLYILQ